MKKTFAAKGIKVMSEGEITGEKIDKDMLIDQHYYAIASKVRAVWHFALGSKRGGRKTKRKSRERESPASQPRPRIFPLRVVRVYRDDAFRCLLWCRRVTHPVHRLHTRVPSLPSS